MFYIIYGLYDLHLHAKNIQFNLKSYISEKIGLLMK